MGGDALGWRGAMNGGAQFAEVFLNSELGVREGARNWVAAWSAIPHSEFRTPHFLVLLHSGDAAPAGSEGRERDGEDCPTVNAVVERIAGLDAGRSHVDGVQAPLALGADKTKCAQRRDLPSGERSKRSVLHGDRVDGPRALLEKGHGLSAVEKERIGGEVGS